MAPLPKISIVTASFNSARTICETIESVLQQRYSNFEHIVVDGGSKDGTIGLLKQHPHLRWISEKDEGLYHAMNKGIEMATGEVVSMLNSDDTFRPGALKAIGEAFAKHPEWDALFGDIVFVDANGNELYRREEALFDYDVLRWSGVCYVIHPTLFVKKAVHDWLGLYQHRDYVSAADGEFILRLGKAGCRVGHVNEYLVNFRYHEFGQSSDQRVARNMIREWRQIREAHGVRFGGWGRCVSAYYRGKRQWQKLIHRGRIDVLPGTFKMRKVMRPTNSFKTNIDMERIDPSR